MCDEVPLQCYCKYAPAFDLAIFGSTHSRSPGTDVVDVDSLTVILGPVELLRRGTRHTVGEIYTVFFLSFSITQSIPESPHQKKQNKKNRHPRTHYILSNADNRVGTIKIHLLLPWTLLLSIVYAGAVVLIRCGTHSQHQLSLLLRSEQRRKHNKSQLTLLNTNGNPISFQKKKCIIYIVSFTQTIRSLVWGSVLGRVYYWWSDRCKCFVQGCIFICLPPMYLVGI